MADNWNGQATFETDQPQNTWGDQATFETAPTPQPQKLPDTFINRFINWTKVQGQKDKAQADEFFNSVKEGFGESVINWSDPSKKKFQDWGLWPSPQQLKNEPNSASTFIKSTNQLLMEAIPAVPDVFMRGLNAAVKGVSTMIGQEAGNVTGDKTVGTRTADEAYNMMNWWMLDAMSKGGNIMRTEFDPISGQPTQSPVGKPPAPEDFGKVAKVLGDERAGPTVENAYKQQGITPQEIAVDATKDPTIKQDVLTKQPTIQAYEGTPATPEQWVQQNTSKLLTMSDEEFQASTKAAGLDPNEVLKHISERSEAPVSVWQDDKGAWVVNWKDPKYGNTFQARSNSDGISFKTQADAVEFAKRKSNTLFDTDNVYVDQGLNPKPAEPGEQGLEAETGKPITVTVYHGTNGDFQNFDISKSGSNTSIESSQGGGIFTTTSPEEASKYAGEQGGNVRPLETTLNNPLVIEFKESQITDIISQDGLIDKYMKQAKAEGRDGLILKSINGNNKDNMVIAFNDKSVSHKLSFEYSAEEANKKISDQISVGDEQPYKQYTFDQVYTRMVDDLNPVRVAMRWALDRLGVKRGLVEGTAQDPYALFRLLRGVYGKADSWINFGTRDFLSGKVNGLSLREILKPYKKDMTGLRNYIASKRAIELDGRGIDSGFDIKAAQKVVETSAEKYEGAAQALVDFQNRITKYYKDAGMLSDEAYTAMLEANKEYFPFYRHFDPEEGVLGGRNVSRRLGAAQTIKKIVGSERQIVDPIESIIKNTYAYLSLADKNAAGLKLVDWLKAADEAETGGPKMLELTDEGTPSPTTLEGVVADAKKAQGKGNTISVYRNGVRETYNVADRDLVNAWSGLDQQSASLITKLASIPASTLRSGATLMPDFMVRNLIRDFFTAFVNSKGLIFHPFDVIKGGWAQASNTKLARFFGIEGNKQFQDWLANGGANGAMVSLDRRYVQAQISDLNAQTGFMKGAWNIVKSPLDGLRMTSEFVENSTRLGEYMKLAGKDKASQVYAAFSAREVTLDFARVGSQMRAWNMVSAFLNANIQGTDRIMRAFKDAPAATTAKLMGGITIPSIILWAHHHNNPRYQNLPDWQKDLYWIFITDDWQPSTLSDVKNRHLPDYLWRQTPDGKVFTNEGHIWRVPKPFEVGVMFGTGAERMLDAFYDHNPKAGEAFRADMLNSLIPQVMPTVGVPLYEQWANRSMFTGEPVVSDYLAKQLPEYQYDQYTSTTAKAIGQSLASFNWVRDENLDPNATLHPITQALTSPKMMENYVRNWTGGLGMWLLQAADAGFTKAGVFAPKVEPTPTLSDIPFIKAFTVRYPSASLEPIQNFYDRNQANMTVMTSLQAQANAGNAKAVRTIADLYKPRLVMQDLQTTIGQQTAAIRMIYDNPKLSQDEKRRFIDRLYYDMLKLSQAGNQVLDAMDKKLQEAK